MVIPQRSWSALFRSQRWGMDGHEGWNWKLENTWYISGIFIHCQLGDYISPTTHYGNQKQLLNDVSCFFFLGGVVQEGIILTFPFEVLLFHRPLPFSDPRCPLMGSFWLMFGINWKTLSCSIVKWWKVLLSERMVLQNEPCVPKKGWLDFKAAFCGCASFLQIMPNSKTNQSIICPVFSGGATRPRSVESAWISQTSHVLWLKS